MKRWMTSLAPNRRTKFVSFTSRLLGESLTWKGGSRLALARTYWALASGFLGQWVGGYFCSTEVHPGTKLSTPVHWMIKKEMEIPL